MSDPSIADQQSIPPGYFDAPPSLLQIWSTMGGVSQELNAWTPASRAQGAGTEYGRELDLRSQDLTRRVMPGLRIMLGSALAEETSVSLQHARAKTALNRLHQLKKRAQQLEKFAKETKWLAENSRLYAGRWIALDGDHLMAEGTTAKEVFAKVEDHVTPPLVIQIQGDALPFAGW